MRVLHWPLVMLAAVGSIVVWVPSMVRLLPQAGAIVLRTASLLLIFLAVATIPLNNPVRFAVPVLPAPMAVQTASSGWNRTSQSTSSQTKREGHDAARRGRLFAKPETFDFLGFAHFCTRSCKCGSFVIERKTIKKRMLKQLQAVKMELRKRMHDPHRQDRGVAESDAQRVSELLRRFRKQPEPVVALQRGAMALDQVAQATQPACIHELGEVHQHNRPLLPVDQDTTPTAMSPLRCQNPRDEPGALAAHAGILAGGWQQPLLPRPTPCIGAPFFPCDNGGSDG
jgi:hypothetical protein